MMTFAWPWLALLLPIPLLARLLAPGARPRQTALVVPDAGTFEFPGEGAERRGRVTIVRLILLWLGWCLLVTAMTRPRLIGEPVLLPTTGRDLMLAVDISGSMSTEDLVLGQQPADRLTVVKSVVREFVARRRGDRVGLVLFGTRAYLQAPLTFDLDTVETLLLEAPVGIAGGKTAIGDAIGLAVKRLRHRPAESRLLILLTDGSSNAGEVSPERAAILAADAGIRIHTIGVGSEAMLRPAAPDDGPRRIVNPSSGLDQATLEAVARITGGRHFRASDTAGLREVYRRIDAMEPTGQDALPFRPVRELYHFPLAAAALLLLAATAPWPDIRYPLRFAGAGGLRRERAPT